MRTVRIAVTLLAGTVVAIAVTSCAKEVSERQDEPVTGPVSGPAGTLHVNHGGGTGGIPVVFVHSFAGSSAHWTPQLAHLRPTRRAIAIDLRGHGQSDPPASGAWDADSLAGDIAAAVDQLNLERFVLVGHSMGGAAAAAYAGAHPDRVAGLVLVGTPGRTPLEMGQQVVRLLEADYPKVSEDYWKKLLAGARPEVETQIRADITKVPRDASLAIIRAMFAFDPMPSLARYTGPKLLIDTPHGESSGSIHNLAPEIPRRVITGTSHWPQLDRPDEFNRILDEFLATIPAPAHT